MSEETVCSVCGASGVPAEGRCLACGARLESLRPSLEPEEARGLAQETFRWLWVGISAGGFLAWSALALIALPMIIGAYDPQGLPGLAIAAAGWLVIALGLAAVSPGHTIFEPAVGAVAAVLPTILYVRTITDVRTLGVPEQVFGGLLGILLALLGGVLGDKLQRKWRGATDG